jgi:hypothetical protein
MIGSGPRSPISRTASDRDHERGGAGTQPRSINATVPVKVIISCSNADHLRALKVLDELGLANNRYVTLIDARATNKPSASVA